MIKKLSLFLLLLLISTSVFAAEGTLIENREEMVTNINKAVILIGQFIGVLLLIVGVLKMKSKADQPTNPQHSTGMIITVLVAGALMINYAQATTSVIASVLYDDREYCFVLDDSHSDATNCWSSETAESTGKLGDRIDRLVGDGEGAADFRRNVDILMAFFQLIGLIYFFKGAYGLKQVSDGGQKGGYGKPIITMIAAALVLDLPHTLEVILETINKVGFSIT